MARPKKTEKPKETKAKANLVCIPIYKGKFGQTAPERKGKWYIHSTNECNVQKKVPVNGSIV